MHDNWAEVRRRLDQVLESERLQRQARRRQQPVFWQALRAWCESRQAQTPRRAARQPS
jgi:hypothetical protein